MSRAFNLATLCLATLVLSACATGSQERAERAEKMQRQQERATNTQAETLCINSVHNTSRTGKVKGLRVINSGPAGDGKQVNLEARGRKWRCIVNANGSLKELTER